MTGQEQIEVDASISLPIPASETQPYKIEYRNEANAFIPNAACPGSPNVPGAAQTVAKEGQMCVFRGNQLGNKETEDLHAEFIGFQDATGNELHGNATGTEQGKTEGAGKSGKTGVQLVFRSNEPPFVPGSPGTLLTAPTRLVAKGSWALVMP